MRADPAGWPYQDPGGDDPDWTGGDGHPDWPAGDDSWPAGDATAGWPYGDDHPSWPAGTAGPNWTAGDGSWPGGDGSWPAGGASPGWPYGEDHPSWPAGSDHPGWPRGGGSGQPGWEPPAAPDDGRWPPDPDWPQITANGQAELLDPLRRDTGGLRAEDSVRLADRILLDAGSQAASVRQQAEEQASAIREAAEREAEEIRRQAAYEADAACEAERKAEELKRRAAEQAEAMREAAVREADELRADAIRLSAELGEVAAYVTRTLAMPAIPAPGRQAEPRQYYTEDLDGEAMLAADPETWGPAETWEPEGWEPEGWEPAGPPARPPGRQASRAGQDGRATTRPAPRPHQRPAGPATRPVRRTDKPARSRQYRTMRAFAGTITALVVLALGTGAYQLVTRGFTFFAFRSAGTGATDNNAVFPGTIPAPKPSPAHHHPTTGPRQHGARRAHHHGNGTAGR